MKRALPAIVVCVVSFFIVSSYIDPFLSVSNDPSIQMLRHVQANPTRYDHLFVGSSLIQWHIDTEIFDAEMAKTGLRTNSVVIAGPSAKIFENLEWLRVLAGTDGFKPKTIFIDVADVPVRLWNRSGNWMHPRLIYWRTWENVRATANWARQHRDGWTATNFTLYAGLHWLAKIARLGAWSQPIVTKAPDLGIEDSEWRSDAAFRFKQAKGFIREEYEDGIRKLKQALRPEPRVYGEFDYGEYLKPLLSWFPATRFVFIISPLPRVSVSARLEPMWFQVMNFNDPYKYPSLYRFENRYDAWHLLAPAAKDYTALIAKQYRAMGDLALRGTR